jgi:hypothetical protein
MKHIYILIFLLYSVLAMAGKSQSQDELPVLEGPYLGQKPPGLTPEVFAPGIISTKGWEYGVVFAPGMKEIYFIREVDADTNPKEEFVVFEKINNRWHERVISPRRGTPTLSPDGKIMYFGGVYKERTDTGWSDSKKLGSDFEEIPIMRVTVSANGTYVLDEAADKSVLRYSRLVDGVREAPKPLPEQINTGEFNAHPFIAPDESYIIWDGQRNSAVRNADLFISFRQSDGTWGEAIKMGDSINTSASEFAAFVTPDGKYLFFNRDMGPDNTDTFWVDARIIDNLRRKQQP